jgi:hypothetical protein
VGTLHVDHEIEHPTLAEVRQRDPGHLQPRQPIRREGGAPHPQRAQEHRHVVVQPRERPDALRRVGEVELKEVLDRADPASRVRALADQRAMAVGARHLLATVGAHIRLEGDLSPTTARPLRQHHAARHAPVPGRGVVVVAAVVEGEHDLARTGPREGPAVQEGHRALGVGIGMVQDDHPVGPAARAIQGGRLVTGIGSARGR